MEKQPGRQVTPPKTDSRLTFVGDSGLSTNAHNGIVGMHTVDEVFERVGVDFRVGVDLPSAPLAITRWWDSP
jgi:hypothetical protein